MARPKIDSAVLTLRVPAALDRKLGREARRRRQTRSEVARHILEAGLSATEPDLATEARRQSRLVRRRRSEREALDFIERASDRSGWR
jgi:predicted transcriptional regulator